MCKLSLFGLGEFSSTIAFDNRIRLTLRGSYGPGHYPLSLRRPPFAPRICLAAGTSAPGKETQEIKRLALIGDALIRLNFLDKGYRDEASIGKNNFPYGEKQRSVE